MLGIKKILTLTNYYVTSAIDVLLYLLLFNESRCCHNLFCQCRIMLTPRWWELTYCFTDVGIGVGVLVHVLILVLVSITPVTKRTPAQNFKGRHVFLFTRALAFDFCYDLDLCSQGQAVKAFSIGMCFSIILLKVQWRF